MRVEFFIETDSGYPKDTGVNKPWQSLVGWFLNQEPQRTQHQYWGLFLRGGSLPPGSRFGIHPKNSPRGGGFESRVENRVSDDEIGGCTEDGGSRGKKVPIWGSSILRFLISLFKF